MTRLRGYALVLVFGSCFGVASARAEVLVRVQYYKTGLETAAQAEKLGQEEVENTNPCVVLMKGEAEKWASSSTELKDAAAVVGKHFEDSKVPPFPVIILRYMNDSMQFVFELRSPEEKDTHGKVKVPEKPVYRKYIVVSGFRGDWKDRVDRKECRLGDDRFSGLLDAIREADRLEACKERKAELLLASQHVNNYIHHYLPEEWIREALDKISAEGGSDTDQANAQGVLREDTMIYRQGNDSYKDCAKGLRLLEAEATESARVLEAVRTIEKQDTPLPTTDLKNLEKVLAQPPKH